MRYNVDLSAARWKKAAMSNGVDTSCVQIAPNLPGVVAIRDSKRPEAGAHVVSKATFAAFLADVRHGRYDI